ncbi:MAG: DJ-1/PfpI family protein [Oscillospiraceae bacterium]|nr:DJ-1/PfpI family protein [Oscillospiraceae bacterium]
MAAAINRKDDFYVKTVSLRKEPVLSIGGFSVNPDYDITEACAVDFSGIVLVGGNSWRTKGVLIALSAMSEKEAEQWYQIYKYGYYEAMESGMTFGA